MYPFRTEFCLNYRDSWQVNVVEPLCFVGENCHLSRKWEPAAALHRACHKSWILLGNMCTWNPNDNWQGSQSNTSSLSLKGFSQSEGQSHYFMLHFMSRRFSTGDFWEEECLVQLPIRRHTCLYYSLYSPTCSVNISRCLLQKKGAW